MNAEAKQQWQEKRTEETRQVEELLREQFPQADAYRYNSASIRVRVVDPRFKGKSHEKRDAMVEPVLDLLPEILLSDIMNLLTLYPGETETSLRAAVQNLEFENPNESML